MPAVHWLDRLRETAHMLYGTLGAFMIAGAVASTIEDSALRDDSVSCAELVDRLESMRSELLEDTRALTIDELAAFWLPTTTTVVKLKLIPISGPCHAGAGAHDDGCANGGGAAGKPNQPPTTDSNACAGSSQN